MRVCMVCFARGLEVGVLGGGVWVRGGREVGLGIVGGGGAGGAMGLYKGFDCRRDYNVYLLN